MIVRVPREQASNSSSSLVLAAQPPTTPASPRDGYAHGRLPCAVRAPQAADAPSPGTLVQAASVGLRWLSPSRTGPGGSSTGPARLAWSPSWQCPYGPCSPATPVHQCPGGRAQTPKSPARGRRDPDSRSRPNRGFPDSRFWPNRGFPPRFPAKSGIGGTGIGDSGVWTGQAKNL